MIAILKKIKPLSIIRILSLLMLITFLPACGNKEPSCSGEKWEEFNNNGGTCAEFLAREQQECWQSNILGLLYDSMGRITMNAYEDLTVGAMSLTMVIFSVWFAFELMKYLGSLKEGDSPSKFWSSILRKFFFCFICGYLASSSQGLLWVLNAVIFPIFNAFLELASYLLAQVTKVAADTPGKLNVFGEEYATAQRVCSVSTQLLYAPADQSGFPQGTNAMMQCLICNVSEKLSLGRAIAYKLMGLGMLFSRLIALTLLVCFAFVQLGFVFYLVETIFKFTMMVVMLPIFIIGFPFDQTRKWMIDAFKIILSGAAYVLAISVVISLAIAATIQLINTQDLFNAPLKDFTIFSPVIMVLLMIAFLVKKTMGVAGDIAKVFSSSRISSKFQEALRGMLKMAAQGIASIITVGSLAPVFQKYNWMKKIYDNGVKMKKRIDNAKNKLDQLSGASDDDDDDEGQEEEGGKN